MQRQAVKIDRLSNPIYPSEDCSLSLRPMDSEFYWGRLVEYYRRVYFS